MLTQTDVVIGSSLGSCLTVPVSILQVIKVEKSFVNMLPSKVEITLHKGSPGTWARLEHPQSPSQVQRGPLEPDTLGALVGGGGSLEEESEDSFSWSEEDEEGWEEENQSQGLSGCVSDGN